MTIDNMTANSSTAPCVAHFTLQGKSSRRPSATTKRETREVGQPVQPSGETPYLPRGLNSAAAMAYLGIRRRAWNTLRRELRSIRIGTSVVYDRHDLDELFERLRAAITIQEPREVDASKPCNSARAGAELPMDGRPRQQKGGKV